MKTTSAKPANTAANKPTQHEGKEASIMGSKGEDGTRTFEAISGAVGPTGI